MIFKTISSRKSRTIGILDRNGKTKFKKVDFYAEAELEDGDDEVGSRQKLSSYIDEYFEEETAKVKKTS